MKKVLYVFGYQDLSEAERLDFQAELEDDIVFYFLRNWRNYKEWVEVAQSNDCIAIASPESEMVLVRNLFDSPIPVYRTGVRRVVASRKGKDGEEELFMDHFGIERVV